MYKQQAENEKSFAIENAIFTLSNDTFNLEDTRYNLGQLGKLSLTELMEINHRMHALRKDFEEKIKSIATQHYKHIQNLNIDISSFYRGSQGIGGYFKNLSLQRFDKIIPNSYVTDTIANDRWLAGSCSKTIASIIEEHKETWRHGFEEIQQLINASYPSYLLYGLVTNLFYPMALLNEVSRTLSEIKHNEKLLLISDFNYLINTIVEKEPIPFIYERIGSKFRHFMIDEFQDTSILQWQNLIPLLENMLADGHFCMLVGDGKQAIYRWRNGEVEQFSSLPKLFKKPDLPEYHEREATLERNFNEAFLDTNYRSGKTIVEFNNSLYDFLSASLDERLKPIYFKQQQQTPSSHPGGYVQIDFSDLDQEVDELPDYIAQRISDSLQDGWSLKDIGILCRSNKQATSIAAGLLSRGLPVVSAESLLLDGYPTVSFLRACLTHIADADDSIARAAIIRYLWYSGKITTSDLHSCLQKSKESARSFRTLLEEYGFTMHAISLLKMPLYDLCEELIRIFRLQSPADPYLQFFLDAVRDFNKQRGGDIAGFALWWEEKKGKLSITVPEGMDAVNVLTIHKSKGLEFPVVIFPANDKIKQNTIPRVWAEFSDEAFPKLSNVLLPTSSQLIGTSYEEIHETEKMKTRLDFINLLYVATTRAAQCLYIHVPLPSKDPQKMNSVQDIMAYYLKNTGSWDEGKTSYTFGNRNQATQESIAISTELRMEHMISESWQDRILLSLQFPGSDQENTSTDRRIWGNLVHTALSRMSRTTDIDFIISQMTHEGLISEHHKTDFENTMNQIVTDKELADLIDAEGEVHTEAEILTADGKSYRPDRVTLRGNKALIIDYKTGEAKDSHKEQVARYATLLNDMGYSEVSMVLVYIGSSLSIVKL